MAVVTRPTPGVGGFVHGGLDAELSVHDPVGDHIDGLPPRMAGITDSTGYLLTASIAGRCDRLAAMRVLVIEDDEDLAAAVVAGLRADHLAVDRAGDAGDRRVRA